MAEDLMSLSDDHSYDQENYDSNIDDPKLFGLS